MNTADFALDLRACLAPAHHLGVGSGRCVVQPWMPTVCGVSHCFAPPLAARGLRFAVTIVASSHRIRDDGNTGKGDCGLLYAGGRWTPDRLERHGTYHRRVEDQLISLHVASELTPLFDRAGFVLNVTVRNRGETAMAIDLMPDLEPGTPCEWPLSKWDFPLPPEGAAARSTGTNRWGNGDVDLHLTRAGGLRTLAPGKEEQWQFAVVLMPDGSKPNAPADLTSLATSTHNAWSKRLTVVSEKLPLLESDPPELAAYYRRALASGLVCWWERDDFICNPFITTCGMDGGGICTYPWDVGGYAPNTLSILLGQTGRGLLGAMGSFGLEKHGRFSPAGNGLNVAYAYSGWSYLSLVWAMACQHGPDAQVFDEAVKHFLAIEKSLNLRNQLADYGTQANLLEMRGTGWEHFTPSPNAERAWCFDRLADLGDSLGRGEPATWRQAAADIRRHIRTELWDADAGWFRCIYPNGHRELVYSVQAYDALRAGACDEQMAAAMLTHLRDGAFLGTHGVSSISAEDAVHFELNDPDWSGGGAYTGEGPQLALTLWEAGQPKLAWDVLRRHLWMGQHLPYFPQEHYCDRPAVAGHKRANIISGLTGVEAILFGLIGLSVRLDGSVWIRPQPPEGMSLSIRGLVIRGRSIDVHLSPDRAEAAVDGARQNLTRGEISRLF